MSVILNLEKVHISIAKAAALLSSILVFLWWAAGLAVEKVVIPLNTIQLQVAAVADGQLEEKKIYGKLMSNQEEFAKQQAAQDVSIAQMREAMKMR